MFAMACADKLYKKDAKKHEKNSIPKMWISFLIYNIKNCLFHCRQTKLHFNAETIQTIKDIDVSIGNEIEVNLHINLKNI